MEIMENIPEYVDCEKYESWENFFTELLVTMTADGVEKYSKSTLNVYYLQDWVIAKIKEQMPDEIKNKIWFFPIVPGRGRLARMCMGKVFFSLYQMMINQDAVQGISSEATEFFDSFLKTARRILVTLVMS